MDTTQAINAAINAALQEKNLGATIDFEENFRRLFRESPSSAKAILIDIEDGKTKERFTQIYVQLLEAALHKNLCDAVHSARTLDHTSRAVFLASITEISYVLMIQAGQTAMVLTGINAVLGAVGIWIYSKKLKAALNRLNDS